MAVGTGQAWTPIADKMGRMTDREHRPMPDISWMAATFKLALFIGTSQFDDMKKFGIQFASIFLL